MVEGGGWRVFIGRMEVGDEAIWVKYDKRWCSGVV